jgi:putative transposase
LECADLSELFLAKFFTCARAYTLQDMSIDWPHAPVHRLDSQGIYIVTAGTLHKTHFFFDSTRLASLQQCLLTLAKQYEWQLEAWAIFSNHYHFVARGNGAKGDLKKFVTHLHADTARDLNRLEGRAGRSVWFNFWDTKLTYERSYLARLSYVHQNPVKHGLVIKANQYRWCSAAWFERVAGPAMVKTIYGFKTDKLNIHDDF